MQALRGLPFVLREGLTVALTPPALKRDRFCTVLSVNQQGAEALVRFSGIATMSDAEAVAGCYVLARDADLDLGPLDAAADDLIGRAVLDARYGLLGSIEDVMELPANDVWVVRGPAGEVLLPVIPEVVDNVPDEGAVSVRVPRGLSWEAR